MKAHTNNIAVLKQLDRRVKDYLDQIDLICEAVRSDIKLVRGAEKTSSKAKDVMGRIALEISISAARLNDVRSHCRHEVQRLITGRSYGVYVKGDPITWET